MFNSNITDMIALIILLSVLVLIFYVNSDKAKEKGHDWLSIPIILIFLIFCIVGSIKSCADSNPYPRRDYYEDRVPR